MFWIRSITIASLSFLLTLFVMTHVGKVDVSSEKKDWLVVWTAAQQHLEVHLHLGMGRQEDIMLMVYQYKGVMIAYDMKKINGNHEEISVAGFVNNKWTEVFLEKNGKNMRDAYKLTRLAIVEAGGEDVLISFEQWSLWDTIQIVKKYDPLLDHLITDLALANYSQ